MENQNNQALLAGYKDIYNLINETLGIKGFSRGRKEHLVIGIPIPARIIKAHFVNSSLEVEIIKASPLKDLQLNVSHERASTRSGYYEFVEQGHMASAIKECKHPPTSAFCLVTDSVDLTNPRPFDRIEVELINRQTPAISMDKTVLTFPLENAVEPFAKTLFARARL